MPCDVYGQSSLLFSQMLEQTVFTGLKGEVVGRLGMGLGEDCCGIRSILQYTVSTVSSLRSKWWFIK